MLRQAFVAEYACIESMSSFASVVSEVAWDMLTDS